MITIVVPVYNETKTIRKSLNEIIKFVKRYNKKVEILIINDGSTDSTLNIVSNYIKKYENMKIISHLKNMGVGAALRTGLKNSKGDLIVTIDSDMTYSLNNIPEMIKFIKREKADIVIGTPYLRKEDHKEIPFIRYFFSRCGNLFDQIVFRLPFTTPTCFFRVWRKKSIKNLKINFNRFEGIPESAIVAYKNGLKIIEVPVKYLMKRKTAPFIIDTRKSLERSLKHLEMIFKLILN